MPALPGKAPPASSSLPRRLDPRGPRSVPGTACAPLGARASRPQVGRRPTGVQAGKMPALPGKAPPVSSSLPRRLNPRGPRSVPGTAGAPLGARASRPQVGRRPTGVQAGKMPALPGKAPPVSSSLPRRLNPRGPRSVPGTACVPPGSAGVPPASGPKAHRCSSGQDARVPRKGTACVIVSPEATRPTRPALGPRDRVRPPWERGRPARKWAEGPQVFKRARCPRAQGPRPPIASTCPESRGTRIVAEG